jgi:predicted DNA-binding WGR domain protein
MTAIMLTRIDHHRNMARFYKLDVQPTLFGGWSVVREWGRIGQGGTVRSALYACARDAEAAVDRQRAVKERRGYVATLSGYCRVESL